MLGIEALSDGFYSDMILLVIGGLATIAFFFLRSYLQQIRDEIIYLRETTTQQLNLALHRFETACDAIDQRLTAIEIDVAVVKSKLKDLE
jgi:hypothetical protein